jgi:hypothetical protein
VSSLACRLIADGSPSLRSQHIPREAALRNVAVAASTVKASDPSERVGTFRREYVVDPETEPRWHLARALNRRLATSMHATLLRRGKE